MITTPLKKSLELFSKVPHADMLRMLLIFLNRKTDQKQETTGFWGYSECVLPERTHPRCISNTEGVLNGPLCLAVQCYVDENICTQDNIKWAQNTEISIILAESSQVFLISLNVAGNVGESTVILAVELLPLSRVGEETLYLP